MTILTFESKPHFTKGLRLQRHFINGIFSAPAKNVSSPSKSLNYILPKLWRYLWLSNFGVIPPKILPPQKIRFQFCNVWLNHKYLQSTTRYWKQHSTLQYQHKKHDTTMCTLVHK